MKKISKTILFFGNERLATGVTTTAPSLKMLVSEGYDVKATVVSQDDVGPSRKGRRLEIAETAKQYGIPLVVIDDLRSASAIDELKKYGASVGVLVAYGKLVPESVISLFEHGIINIHPSLLPQHRGSTPIESVILDGSRSSGVTLMSLVKEMDAGPVIDQVRFNLAGNESKQELADKCAKIGADLIAKNLPQILNGQAKPLPQDDAKATYDSSITKSDGIIDWQKSAQQISREVRAYASWPRSRARLAGIDVVITEVAVDEGQGEPGKAYKTDQGDRGLAVYCGQGSLLIKKLVPAGKKEMTGEAFLAGYKI